MLWLMSLVFSSTVGHLPVTGPIPASPEVHRAAGVPAERLLTGDSRRIRSPQPRLLKLMAEGARRSKTFADLLSRIHQTNLIVYVEASQRLGSETLGRILLQTVAGGQRYVRVQVRAMLPRDQTIAVIAHELRHALEVAEDLTVVDDETMAQLYRRIGHISDGRKAFDTDAARSTGIRVREEL